MLLFEVKKVKKGTESKKRKVKKIKTEEQCFHQTVRFFIVKKSRFIKEQDAVGFLSRLRIKTTLNQVPIVGPI